MGWTSQPFLTQPVLHCVIAPPSVPLHTSQARDTNRLLAFGAVPVLSHAGPSIASRRPHQRFPSQPSQARRNRTRVSAASLTRNRVGEARSPEPDLSPSSKRAVASLEMRLRLRREPDGRGSPRGQVSADARRQRVASRTRPMQAQPVPNAMRGEATIRCSTALRARRETARRSSNELVQ